MSRTKLTVDFAGWTQRLEMSHKQAAASLGLSERVAYYYAKRGCVPKFVMLACEELEYRHTHYNWENEPWRVAARKDDEAAERRHLLTASMVEKL